VGLELFSSLVVMLQKRERRYRTLEHVRTKKVGTLEKKKLLREDGGGNAAVLVLFFLNKPMENTRGEGVLFLLSVRVF